MAVNNTVIPNVWKELRNEGFDLGLSGLLNIWENRLRTSKTENDPKPKTIVAVTLPKMVNFVPKDAPHPLYSSDYFQMTDQFILDHLSVDKIDLEDPALETADGITLKMMSGKAIVFKKEPEDGKTTANDIEVEVVKCLSDETSVIIIKNFLFAHLEDCQKAFRKISADITNEFCPLSKPQKD